MKMRRALFVSLGTTAVVAVSGLVLSSSHQLVGASGGRKQLGPPFSYQILSTRAEAPLALRFFTTAVKTDSKGRIITGPNSDPVKNIVGPEAAGERGGLQRFTKIMFGAGYIDGRPDPGTRIDPNNPQVSSGNQKWPNIEQPFRSQPRSLALTIDGKKLYVTLPGREGYPDWRLAVVSTTTRKVTKWLDLRPPGLVGGFAVPWANTARMPLSTSPSTARSACSIEVMLWHQSTSVVQPASIWASAPIRLAM